MALDLEREVVEIEINGRPTKIAKVEGRVTGVTEWVKGRYPGVRGNELHISLEEDTDGIRFVGTSCPIKKGDRIKAGIILDEPNFRRALYIEIFDEHGVEAFGFMDYYTESDRDLEILGIKKDLKDYKF